MKKGLLLVNLGTPAAPTASAVKTYLAQFLADPRVVSLPRFIWMPILKGIVLKTRPKKSAKAYAKIWSERGSPLLVHTSDLAKQTQLQLAQTSDDEWSVAIGMSYGCPCIRNGLQKLLLDDVEEISILPLYPQYSTATTASVYDAIGNIIKQGVSLPPLKQVPPYYQHPLYIDALANSVQAHWQQYGRNEKLLLSFHGLPQSYADKGDPYPEQCTQTAKLLSEKLELSENEWQLTYQSRFGAAKWLQPYTDKTLESLAKQGISRIDTVCPGFAADCLETLEEIALQNAEYYLENGGEQLNYIPALNASTAHAQLMARLAIDTATPLKQTDINTHDNTNTRHIKQPRPS